MACRQSSFMGDDIEDESSVKVILVSVRIPFCGNPTVIADSRHAEHGILRSRSQSL